MPRIPLIEPETASNDVRALYENFSRPDLPVRGVLLVFPASGTSTL